MRWQAGQSGNPRGRPKGRTLGELVRSRARETGANAELADAILTGIRTGWLPLRPVEVGTGHEVPGYRLSELSDWLSLVGYAWPREREALEEPEPGEGSDLLAEAERRGLLSRETAARFREREAEHG